MFERLYGGAHTKKISDYVSIFSLRMNFSEVDRNTAIDSRAVVIEVHT